MKPEVVLWLSSNNISPVTPISPENLILEGKTCAFTGHRFSRLCVKNENEEKCLEIKQFLNTEIKNAVQEGFVNFISGMADGVDIWAAEEVIDLQFSGFPDIRLYAAIPYIGHEKKLLDCNSERYSDILCCCDGIVYISDSYNRYCMHERNAFLVDKSERLIAVFDQKNKGGTYQTISLAKRKRIDIALLIV